MNLTWSSFEWIEGRQNGKTDPKACMAIPFKFKNNSRKYFFQFDTGTPRSYIYGQSLEKLIDLQKYNHNDPISIIGKLDNLEFNHEFILFKQTFDTSKIEEEFGSQPNCLGLLGIDYLIDSQVIIDFPQKRFTIIRDKKIFQRIENNFDFLKAEFNGRFYVNLSYKTPIKVLYDAGGSFIPLLLFNKDLWTEITGKKIKDKNVDNLEISAAFGSKMNLTYAKIIKDIKLLGLNFKNKLAYLEHSGKTDWSKLGCDGIIGNNMFYDKSILLLDFINKRMGISEKSEFSIFK